MSRIGNKPIALPAGVQINIKSGEVEVKGPKGMVLVPVNSRIKVEKDGAKIVCKRPSELKTDKSLHGTVRALLNNAVKGVTDGFKKEFEIVGIGYRAAVEKQKLVLTVGYSHPAELDIPADMKITFDEKNKNKFVLSGSDRQAVGQFAAQIRGVRPPDPYKGKGLKYADEHLKLKEGKKKA